MKHLTELLADLVRIDSVNPALISGGRGEAEIAAHIARWGADAGMETEVLEETNGRPSVPRVRARAPGVGARCCCAVISTP